ncbi:HAMP domain-containing histidine kinase [Clostridium botulinum]|uniref:sensor histidine kinase n=2 Tax=Clostridium botulinum TaxID=1491 RepID=UPI001A93389A|nr:sensor histidine kinase [Clostridium botulinum]MBO0525766.1 HAMP domain-containing histidine kinase [Clostridium botulinum]MBO0528403.1 HAMP domain-containing histidine kinase [Clostridium botulinum]MBO0533060.1 HAMP domain-containing histidine kinase [Clostridium botulinum]MBO0536651.1 HAMP domain-containing histidine kinase [Clostridium botulinum]MBO0539688.1 HAMP domain-containing histidine kinase [Clostridium botulinum]
MKLREYLRDRRNLIIFFIILMTFIGGVIFFDRSIRILKSNAEYIVIVSFSLFTIYLAIDYIVIARHVNKIKAVSKKGADWVNSLPSSISYEQKIYLDVINKLYENTNIQIEKLIDKNNESVEFLTTWVHEIKTPIAASKLIIENNLNSENEKMLYGIEMEIEKVEDYVEKALFYSRINDFSKDYRIDTVKLEDSIKESIKSEASWFINKDIKLEMKNLDIEIDSDYKWLQFIIKQILDNAIKYTGKSGIIKIYTEVKDKEKILHIKDTGIGIKKDDIERVFEKSFTGYNGRLKIHSTGMGLYISQKLAGKLGHYITIDSEYGKGADVSIHFPRYKEYFFS